MTEKALILDELGEDGLLAPVRIERALTANDQIKYYFALLQAARVQGDAPEAAPPDLRRERLAARVEDRDLDAVVANSRRLEDGAYHVHRGAEICARVRDGIAAMVDAVPPPAAGDYAARLAGMADAWPGDDVIPGQAIDHLTSGDRKAGDSPHILVMDLHKEINRLQVDLAQEDLDGAKVYGLSAGARPLVSAFMEGLNRTAPLKFDHPGLGTTATEFGQRLVIQNDIGTTDAHVLVVTIEGMTVNLTYTDIHLRRLSFFRDLFASFPVEWEAARRHRNPSVETGSYQLTTGTYEAADEDGLKRYLAFIGSRIVFLIDWNKARKRLRNFVDNPTAIGLLAWAADNDIGHRGFLELGGEKAVYEAIELSVGGRLRYGDRLDDLLGKDTARDFLAFVLQVAKEGLLQGRSDRLIKDEIKAELLKHFDSAHQGLLDTAVRHAGYITEIAAAVEDGIARAAADVAAGDALLGAAARCREWEIKADNLLNKARKEVQRTGQSETLLRIFERLDDSADDLEEAAFLLTLVAKRQPAADLFPPVVRMAEQLVEGSREMVKGLASAQHISRGGPREAVDDLFATVDRVLEIEHLTDDGVRSVAVTLFGEAVDFRDMQLVSQLAAALEQASDSLAVAAQLLRGFVLDEVLAQ